MRPSRLSDVHRPQRRLFGRAGPTAAQERRPLREVLRLDEELPEGGMGQVVRRRGEDDLRVARDLDLAGTVAVVRDRQPPHLDVVLGGDRDVEERRDAVVAAAEARLLGEERHQVVLGLSSHRVVGRRPHPAAAHVPQIDELASRVARGVLAVARDHAVPPEAGAPAGVRHDRGVAAVRQELGVWPQRVRRSEATQGQDGRRARRARLLDRTGLGDGCLARDPLLQQQLGGLHARVGVEAPHHRVVEQHVGERDEGHALVVGHEGAHDGSAGRAGALAGSQLADRGVRVVDRLVVAVGARASLVRRGVAGCAPRAAAPPSRRAPSRRAPRPARRRGPASGRGRGRRRPCTGSCRGDR